MNIFKHFSRYILLIPLFAVFVTFAAIFININNRSSVQDIRAGAYILLPSPMPTPTPVPDTSCYIKSQTSCTSPCIWEPRNNMCQPANTTLYCSAYTTLNSCETNHCYWDGTYVPAKCVPVANQSANCILLNMTQCKTWPASKYCLWDASFNNYKGACVPFVL